MENSSSKSNMNKILRLLPKAAQASVSFQNPHFSPARDRRATGTSQKLKSHTYPPFSGPIIPFEAREESENFETQEPTSPKISCMGQIKHRKKICNEKYASLPTEIKPVLHPRPGKLSRTVSAGLAAEVLRRKASGIKKVFGGGRKRCDDEPFNQGKPPLPDRAPCLSQMMRFASSRDAFMYYDDWTTESGGDFYSGGDWGSYGGDCDEDVKAMLVAGAEAGFGSGLVLEPRKEVNLWKRRTVAQLKPLQLNVVKS